MGSGHSHTPRHSSSIPSKDWGDDDSVLPFLIFPEVPDENNMAVNRARLMRFSIPRLMRFSIPRLMRFSGLKQVPRIHLYLAIHFAPLRTANRNDIY